MYPKPAIVFFFVITVSFSTNNAFSANELFLPVAADVPEPKPPGVPQPEPEPEPIPLPTPKPIPDPFPEESDSEKIERLTQENRNLKNKIEDISWEKHQLELQIIELEKKIENLQKIIMEQIKVIAELVERIKQTTFALSHMQAIMRPPIFS